MKILILFKEENNALAMINESSCDVLDYQMQGYELVKTGSKKECLQYIEEFWDENYIPDDSRIFLNLTA